MAKFYCSWFRSLEVRIGYQHSQVRALCPNTDFSLYPHMTSSHGRRGLGAQWGVLYKSTDPIYGASLLLSDKNPPAKAGDPGSAASVPGMGRSPGVGNSHSLQYSCSENSMARGLRRAAVPEVVKRWPRLSAQTHTPVCMYTYTVA